MVGADGLAMVSRWMVEAPRSDLAHVEVPPHPLASRRPSGLDAFPRLALVEVSGSA